MKRLLYCLVLLLLSGAALAAPTRGGPVGPGGVEVQCDLPLELRMFNTGGSNGAGLCVYTSVTHAARYQGEARLLGLRAWAEKRPGGSWPEKLQRDLKTFAPGAPVLQVTGCDLAFLRLCTASGHLPGVTWANQSHMLNLVHLDGAAACVLDNNSPYGQGKDGSKTDSKLLWMTPKEFEQRSGPGIWAVVVLGKGPPTPVPTNAHCPPTPVSTNAHCPCVDCRCDPCACPPAARPRTSGVEVRGRLRSAGTVFTLSGKVIDRPTAEQLVTRGSTLRRLTCVGTTLDRGAFEAAMDSTSLAPWREKLVVQSYGLDEPLAKGVGLAYGVTLQDAPGADGKARVLWRLRRVPDSFTLANALRAADALRRPDPAYQPEKDRDPVSSDPTPVPLQPMVVTTGGGFPASEVMTGLLGIFLAIATWLIARARNGGAAPGPVVLPAVVKPSPPPLLPVDPKPGLHALLTGHPIADAVLSEVIDLIRAHAQAQVSAAARDVAGQLLARKAA